MPNELGFGLAPIRNEGERIVYDSGADRSSFDDLQPAENETWGSLFAAEAREHGDHFNNIIHSTLSDADRDRKVQNYNEVPWLIWTKTRVYFGVVYDGRHSIGSAPRDPSDEKAESFGGGG